MPTFSWKRIFKVVGVVVLAGIIVTGIYLTANLRPVKIAWASMVHNRIEHELSCYDLTFYPHVQKVFADHADIAAKVKNLPGVTDFAPENIHCENYEGNGYFVKGDLVLTYQNRAARQAAEKILGKNFFGIAYRGYPMGNN